MTFSPPSGGPVVSGAAAAAVIGWVRVLRPSAAGRAAGLGVDTTSPPMSVRINGETAPVVGGSLHKYITTALAGSIYKLT